MHPPSASVAVKARPEKPKPTQFENRRGAMGEAYQKNRFAPLLTKGSALSVFCSLAGEDFLTPQFRQTISRRG
jgi:hypothetical protein